MLYSKFIFHAMQKTIFQLENETWYLEPEWKNIICTEIESDLTNLEESYISDWWDVENILRLEVERRNAIASKKNDVINWLYDLLTQQIDDILTDEENSYVANVVEYLKQQNEAMKLKENKDNIVQFPTKE